MSVLWALLPGLALPACLSALILAVSGRLGRPGPEAPGAGWGLPLAIGLGYAAGQVAVLGRPAWPPPESTHWLLVIALAAMVEGLLERVVWPGWFAWILLRVPLLALVVWLILRPLLQPEAEARPAPLALA